MLTFYTPDGYPFAKAKVRYITTASQKDICANEYAYTTPFHLIRCVLGDHITSLQNAICLWQLPRNKKGLQAFSPTLVNASLGKSSLEEATTLGNANLSP